MLYTFSQLIDKLDAAKVFSADLDTAGKKAQTNEGLESLIVSGRWAHSDAEIQVSVGPDGLLTLPRELVTCKGVRVDGNARDMASIWYSYLAQTSDLSQFSTNIQDHGEGWCVFKEMRASSNAGDVGALGPYGLFSQTPAPEAAQLRVACSGETGTVEVHGLDANGKDIYNGAQHGAVLTFNAAKTGPHFTRITNVILPVTDQPATLYACYDDDTEEAIGYYAPGETVPNYRRYLVQEALSGVSAEDSTIVNALCQRRHIDLVADNDICTISNFAAIKLATRSIHWQNEGDEKRQKVDFDSAIDILNKEFLRTKPPTEVGAMRVRANQSGASGIYSAR